MQTSIVRLPVLLLSLVAAAAACTGEKDDEREAIDDESQLLEVVNENRRLEADLAASERRLVETASRNRARSKGRTTRPVTATTARS